MPTLRGLPKPHSPGPKLPGPQPPDVGVPATWDDSCSGNVGTHAKSEPGHPAHQKHTTGQRGRFMLFRDSLMGGYQTQQFYLAHSACPGAHLLGSRT